MYIPLTQCRACGYTDLLNVFSLGVQPLANDFCLPLEAREGWAPLEVLHCPQCTLAQLSVVVDPKVMYGNYPYITSTSKTMQHHFAELCRDLAGACMVKHPMLLEVGSNDGAFLKFATDHDFSRVVGIDPAQNLNCKGPTIHGMFDAHTAEMALESLKQKPDVILARHVFCHVNDWRDFMRTALSLCHENTVIAIEVPYVGDLLKRNEFDSIYHEHTSYLSVNAVSYLLRESGLMLYQVLKYHIHGGSICLLIRKGEQQKFDYDTGVDAQAWEDFEDRVQRNITKLAVTIRRLKEEGNVIGGFGASAKATVWLNACGLLKDVVSFVSDNTPSKIGRLVPGTDIPVVDEARIDELEPDVMILFAWNYREEILEKMKDWRESGGKFIIPVPEVEVV